MPRNADRTNVRIMFNYNPRDQNSGAHHSREFPDRYPLEYVYARDPVMDEDQLRDDIETFDNFADPWLAREFHEAG